MSTAFLIESGVPLPSTHPRAKYPWNALEVGQSFFIPNNFSNFNYINTRLAPKHFIFRVVTEDKVKGTRVWRDK